MDGVSLSPPMTTAARIHAVDMAAQEAAAAQDEFFEMEVSYRIERKRATARVKEANPKMPTDGIELLVEADPTFRSVQLRWQQCHGNKTRAFGKLEVAKLFAWAEVRGSK